MHEHYFDRVIREKLNHLEEIEITSDWEDFEAILNDEYADFDKQLKDKLASHEVPFNTFDWKLMHQELHGALDSSIIHSLDNLAISFESTDWELFEDKLNEPFYQIFRDRLAYHAVSYRFKDWRLMLSKLKAGSLPAKSQEFRKYAVAAAILLLLFFAGVFLRNGKLRNKPSAESERAKVVNKANSKTEFQAPSSISDKESYEQFQTPSPSPSSNDNTSANKNRIGSPSNVSRSIPQQNRPQKYVDNISSPKTIGLNNPNYLQKDYSGDKLDFEDKQEIAVSPKLSTYPDLKEKDIEMDEISSIENVGLGEDLAHYPYSSTLASIDRKTFHLKKGNYHNPNSHKIDKLPHREKIQPEVRIGFYGATTRSRAELNDPAEPGFATGLRAELRLTDEWSLVSGAFYAEKQYTHEFLIFPERGPEKRNQLQANFRAIEIPLLVRYTFPHTSELSLYVQGGIATMIMLEENYAQKDISNDVSSRQAPPVPTPSNRKFNTYVGNAHLAAGLEYDLNENLSLQIEPYFQLGMHKMGRAEKKLYTSGLSFSFIYLLKPTKSNL